jgi:rhodanese-related sulfurtransferase/polyisoprenoid-binding protein YceI
MDIPKKYNVLSPNELHQWIEQGKAFYLIDTLVNSHFQKIHLPTARNACVFEVTFMDQIMAITKEKDIDIVVYGSSSRSRDAVTAAEKLEREGFARVHVLKGGIAAWRSAGLLSEGEGVEEPDDPQTLLKLDDRLYRVDSDRSLIQWTGRNANTSHFGTVKLRNGELQAKNGVFTGIFDIDMNSIVNINLEGDDLQPVLIAHLKSDDFFLAKAFPTATIEINHAKPVKDPFLTVPNYEINATLELRGLKVLQDFFATVTRTPENGLVAEAHFDIDRTKWGVIYGSARFFEHLGMHAVFDLISFQIRVVAD